MCLMSSWALTLDCIFLGGARNVIGGYAPKKRRHSRIDVAPVSFQKSVFTFSYHGVYLLEQLYAHFWNPAISSIAPETRTLRAAHTIFHICQVDA